MLRLLLSLRELHATHPGLSVAAFDSFVGPYRPDKPCAPTQHVGLTDTGGIRKWLVNVESKNRFPHSPSLDGGWGQNLQLNSNTSALTYAD
jgi:hypothetical protein